MIQLFIKPRDYAQRTQVPNAVGALTWKLGYRVLNHAVLSDDSRV